MRHTRIPLQRLLILPLALLLAPLATRAQSAADPPARDLDVERLARDNTAFAIDLYHQLSGAEGNLFFSPYSISEALAMTYAGARGNTEKEMAATLRFSLGQKELHPAFAKVETRLKKVQEAGNVRLAVANSLWPQKGYPFLADYLSLLAEQYGVSVTAVEYRSAAEDARRLINGWVAEKTEDKIRDLIQPGVLDGLTRLVLVNAIYFKGKWEHPFAADKTVPLPFHVATDRSISAPMMIQRDGSYRYAALPSLEILELPYAGDELSMVVLLPREVDGIRKLESELSPDSISRWLGALTRKNLDVTIPRFKMTSMFSLSKILSSMGMVDAFDGARADFSGMDGRPHWLSIGAVIHKAFVEVNEEGTEAAAATAVTIQALSEAIQPLTFRADHPFVFLIREKATGSILFLGRVTDPTKEG